MGDRFAEGDGKERVDFCKATENQALAQGGIEEEGLGKISGLVGVLLPRDRVRKGDAFVSS